MSTPLFSIRMPWSFPYGTFFIEADPLSIFFLILILLLSVLCAVYSKEYMAPFKHKKSLGAFWIFFVLLVLSMLFVVLARNAILFLIAWEVMALSSFFLVTFEQEDDAVSQAGWTYLVATHLGTAFLFVFFILLGNASGSLDFDSFNSLSLSSPLSTLLFLCALIGFGTKAGLIPFHIWLPEAHPAAPSPVSALMSAVMIKTGIYGLLRALMMLGPPPLAWGYVLIGMGTISGIGGILFALAQHDFKKLLAYSSVENIGIITLGMGLGILGLHAHNPMLTILGFLGALLHILNHGLFKGLLFLGAGSILHYTGTRDINQLGGLLKKMPVTGYTFLVGSVAISGLPPLNGFISEFFIYFGAFKGVSSHVSIAIPSMITILSLSLIGGLAVACFTKIFGTLFLGEPRSKITDAACDPSWFMKAPMVLLTFLCFFIGVCPILFIRPLMAVLASLLLPFGFELFTLEEALSNVTPLLIHIMAFFFIFLFFFLILWMLKKRLLSHQKIETSLTWDCGYAFPSPKMQYTSSSFAQPLTTLFSFLLGRRSLPSLTSYFPHQSSFHSFTTDFFKEKFYHPLFTKIEKPLFYLRRFQYGRIQLYIFYILATLLVLLMWQTGIVI